MSAIGSLRNRVSGVATASAGPEPCSASLPSTISAERQCDAHAELSALIAALFEESRQKVMAFFDRKMSSSYRNGRKASLAAAKRHTASVVSTERA